MILLDTNICIHVINAKPSAVLERFRQYRMGEIGLCSVVAAELAYGVANSGSARNRQALEMFLAPLIIFPFDEARSGPTAICGRNWSAKAPQSARLTP